MRNFGLALLALMLIQLCAAPPALTVEHRATHLLALPLISMPAASDRQPADAAVNVHMPYYAVDDLDSKFAELAIFWFGKVTPTQNYADVRIGYNDRELFVYVAVFDRRIWYDRTPQANDLAAWDALTLYLDTATGDTLTANSYKFVAQFSGEGSAAYQAAYRGSGGAWSLQAGNVGFTTRPGWRGEALNDNRDDRGWAMTFRIPFASLGHATPPPAGAAWRMALSLHDRDDAAGSAIADQHWPPAVDLAAPQTWARLGFGIADYVAPAAGVQTVMVRQGLNGVTVPDAAVGGGSICGDGLDFWGEWGDSSREAGRGDFNIQNQSDIADWPCFSKYYVTFPLETLPRGMAVISASLILHQFGNAEPSQARPSLIQVVTVGEDWQEETLSWNNAPPARENIGSGWVAPLAAFSGWPGVPRTLVITRGVAQAYEAGTPLRLALYSADNNYHSGKYFVSSDTGDWNAVARPTLLVQLGARP